MKRYGLILVILFFLQAAPAPAQLQAYKYDEVDYPGYGCREWGRVTGFAQKIIEEEHTKGLIVMYAGEGKERFGNVLAYISGVRRYLVEWHKFPPERISFVIAEGKTTFAEEFWIIPEGVKDPEFKSFNFDWSNLKEKYFFSTGCLQCEPSYPDLSASQANFEKYAEILKQYPNYKGLILVNDYWELFRVRTELSKELKLPRDRYAIQLVKQKKNEHGYDIDLYIIPVAVK